MASLSKFEQSCYNTFAMSKHTIAIFKKMSENLPPLLPPAIKKEIDHALVHLQEDYTVSGEEVENIVIALGKKVWPYWQAFGEFLARGQGQLGEKFLLGKLSPALKQRYNEYKEHGATYHDLRLGGPVRFFSESERAELVPALVEVDQEVRAHAAQAVLTNDQQKYESLIVEFQTIFDDVEKRLGTLRAMAEDEEEHPQVAEEIRARIRAFEFGLCLLGPRTASHEFIHAEDYIEERRSTKKVYNF